MSFLIRILYLITKSRNPMGGLKYIYYNFLAITKDNNITL